MKLLKIQRNLKIFTDLKFALLILILIALSSSIGSFIEQDEPTRFYQENYPLTTPIYGFVDSNLIINLGLDHVYKTWWFLSLLIILGICLISCTITRQFPLFINSKEYFFKQKNKSFKTLPFFVKIQNIYYIKEMIVLQIQKMNFYIYQNKNLIYGYKGLIGRISPILVHFSLIVILLGATVGAFKNFKAQEVLPKGELFHIQNPIGVGWFTSLPNINTRVNDFWVEYEKNKIHQFYSNLSILDEYGNEIKQQTISVNNPLRYKNIDFYQSDWNLLGIRIKNLKENRIYEFPLFSLKENNKGWITWINSQGKNYSLVFDQLQNNFLLYDQKGTFISINNVGDKLFNEMVIIDILPSTGLLLKYDPSIPIIYFGFGLLMITASLSYLPYTQIWVFNQGMNSWIGGITNRGKIQLEIEFENLIRYLERIISRSNLKKN
jgi:cytochrome c biogenesis protein|uniref:Cytochrome c biogenesis protein CcsB n=1 Tax=Ochromonas sp. CCMP1393 TaxID=420556 RepID=A0A0D3ML45_9STRA|nr:ATP cytochrome c biogenesis protein [Ochromonas sp. CCMP1393]AIM52818.1 ATP cytochrome c biogenesis protein [Ochromonas sp. CCMP1393]